MYYIRFFSFNIDLTPNHFDYVRFPVCLWFFYGSLMALICGLAKLTSAPRWSVRTRGMQIFNYRGYILSSKWSNGLIFGTIWKSTNFSHIMSPENVMEITQRVAKIELTLVVFIDVKYSFKFLWTKFSIQQCFRTMLESSAKEHFHESATLFVKAG